ncbi:MAG: hypothetical protein ACXVDN_16505 [Ktedonobacteraceae bacterium]
MHRSMIPFFILRSAIGVSICAVIVAWCFSSALAAPVTTHSTTPHKHIMGIYKGQKFKSAGTNLIYQGGSVETAPLVYISWWGTQWNTGFSTGGYSSATAQTYITNFFSNVGGSSWDNINTQYCQGITVGSTSCGSSGTHITNPTGQLAGTWVDTTSVPTRPTQSQIQSAATRLMNHFGGYNANATYFVFTPHSHSMSGFGTSWCAWHDEPTSGTDIAYAYMPYIPDAGTSCGRNFVNKTNNSYGNGYFDGFSIVGGHEYAEAATDPHPERTSTNFGWITNTGSSGQEIGDLCAWASNSTNITLGSHFYATQPLWSNASSGCVNSY